MGQALTTYTAHRTQIREVAKRYPVTNIRVFGSVARGEDSDDELLPPSLSGYGGSFALRGECRVAHRASRSHLPPRLGQFLTV